MFKKMGTGFRVVKAKDETMNHATEPSMDASTVNEQSWVFHADVLTSDAYAVQREKPVDASDLRAAANH